MLRAQPEFGSGGIIHDAAIQTLYYSINTLLSTNLNTKSAKNLQQTRMIKEVTNIIHKFNSYYTNIYHFKEHD